MKSLFKNLALFVAVVCVVWFAVVWHLRSHPREMEAGDIAVYFVLVPLVVFVLVVAMRWAVSGALAKQAAQAAALSAASDAQVPAAASASSSSPTPTPTDPGDVGTWYLQCAWVNTHGGDVDALAAAALEGAPRPRPDAVLTDDDGMPLMSARIAELDTDVVDDALARAAAAALPSAAGNAPPPARAVRALAGLSPLIDELGQSLLMWATFWDEAAAADPAREAPVVRVLAGWPADWDDTTCLAAQEWLTARLCDPLVPTFTRARWAIRCQRMNGAELLTAAERVLDALRRQDRDDPVVLLACHSDLDAAAIRRLDSEQRLFHAEHRPKTAMAGEGAAVLVVSARAWPAAMGADGQVRLASPALVRRSQSIEAPGRASADESRQLVLHSLQGAGVPVAAIGKLASDADQHTARATELFAVSLELLPTLVVDEDLYLAGTISGRLDAAAPLVTLALAAHLARETGKPAVALSLADTHWRMAAVLRPESFYTSPVLA